MKWMPGLWDDPIGFSEGLAKTKIHVLIWTLIHLVLVLAGFLMMGSYDLVKRGAPPIVFIGVFYPSMYLYAMYRLLRMIRERETKPQNKELNCDAADRAP